MKWSLPALALFACAHGQPQERRVDFQEPMVITGDARGEAARADFQRGEALAKAFDGVTLDPSKMDDRTLADALESKARLLLDAQEQYLGCIRRGDADWATAAGTRIGQLYEAMHAALVRAPRPTGLTQEQERIYDRELRAKVHGLLEKAVRAYDETIALAERNGAQTGYVEKARASLERLRAMLLDTI